MQITVDLGSSLKRINVVAKKEKSKIIENISAEFIAKLVADNSDFAFEMQVQHELRNKCSIDDFEHSGTYNDPITSLLRQFDIRARKDVSQNCSALLAIECKNLNSQRPLIVHAIRRRNEEAWHCLVAKKKSSDAVINAAHRQQIVHLKENYDSEAGSVILKVQSHDNSPYQQGHLVGKSVDQIIEKGDGSRKLGDQDFYQKFSQAISSCFGLIHNARKDNNPRVFAIIPIVVIPDNTLWQIEYENDGKVVGNPQSVEHASFFIDQTWEIDKVHSFRFPISHLGIITLSELENFIKVNIVGSLNPYAGKFFNGILS